MKTVLFMAGYVDYREKCMYRNDWYNWWFITNNLFLWPEKAKTHDRGPSVNVHYVKYSHLFSVSQKRHCLFIYMLFLIKWNLGNCWWYAVVYYYILFTI